MIRKFISCRVAAEIASASLVIVAVLTLFFTSVKSAAPTVTARVESLFATRAPVNRAKYHMDKLAGKNLIKKSQL